jgi:hypothetical protein
MKNSNTRSIDHYLRKVIQESLQESRRTNLFEQDEDALGKEGGGDEFQKLKKGEVSYDDVVEKINSIRSGKTLRDKDISSNLETYFNDLSTAEKVALFAYLKAISQILTGEIEAEKAQDPGETPASVDMKKVAGGGQKKSIKPNVIRLPEEEKEKKGKPAENTKGPVPIKPKK